MADEGSASGGHEGAAGGGEGTHPLGQAAVEAPAERSAAARNQDKVMILAKNVANAPILKTTQFSASASHPFSKVIQHIQVAFPGLGLFSCAFYPYAARASSSLFFPFALFVRRGRDMPFHAAGRTRYERLLRTRML